MTPANAVSVPTGTTISPFNPTIDVGGSIDFTATLTSFVSVFPSPVPNETIDFENATTLTDLGSVTTDVNGMATLLVAFGVVGTFDIKASFGGLAHTLRHLPIQT